MLVGGKNPQTYDDVEGRVVFGDNRSTGVAGLAWLASLIRGL